MTPEEHPSPPVSRPGKIVVGAVYLLYLAVFIRTLTNPFIRPRLPAYLVLEFIYLFMFTWMLWYPTRRLLWKHLYFVFQSILVLALIALRPRFDFIIILFVLLSFQAVQTFLGRARWIWVATLALFTSVPLMVTLGALQGLSLALMPMTIGIVFAAYVAVTKDIEAGLNRRQVLLTELQDANQRLMVSTSQVEELSAIQERNRLARELHDSVSQTIFGIALYSRSAQITLERDPDRLRPQLEYLQSLTQNALAEMRGLIAHLRPQNNETAQRPRP